MLRKLQWLAFTAPTIFVVYAGYEMDIERARNVAAFLLWLFFLLSFFAFTKDVRDSVRAKGRAVPAWVNALANATILLILVANGEFVLGTVWILTVVFQETVYVNL